MLNIFPFYIGATIFSYLTTGSEPTKEDVCQVSDSRQVDYSSRDCSFLQNSCMCSLQAGCEYDGQSGTCIMTTDCSKFRNQPTECRKNNCVYECATSECNSHEGITGLECGWNACSLLCNDICKCKGDGCEYDITTATCKKDDIQACTDDVLQKQSCLIPNSIYYYNGKYCRYNRVGEFCDYEKVVIAVNFNGEETSDELGVQYLAWKRINYVDVDNILTTYDLRNRTTEHVNEIYLTGISGIPSKRHPNRCITFSISLCEEGMFHVSIKLIQLTDSLPGEQLFNIKLGNRYMFPEIDVAKLARERFRPIELSLTFHIKDRVLYIEGQDPFVVSTNLPLSLCYGLCSFSAGAFYASAFSILKLKDSTDSRSTSCGKYKQENWECGMSGCYYNVPKGICSVNYQEKFCSQKCHKATPVQVCKPEMFDGKECVRPGRIYSVGGELCNSSISAGHCHIVDIVQAVNLNGIPVVDSHGITYTSDARASISDPHKIRRTRTATEKIKGISSTEQQLYGTFVYGDPSKQDITRCIEYKIPLCEDGLYSLVLNTADDVSDQANMRKFNVRLGNTTIFEEVDVFELTGEKSKALDLAINFEVTDGVTKVKLKHFASAMPINMDKTISLGFCNSNCSDSTIQSFMVAGFSVSKTDSAGSYSVCTAQDGNSCGCRALTFCEFNVTSRKCLPREEVCRKPCSQRDMTSTICRRGGEQTFYAIGGVLCKQKSSSGDCSIQQVLDAANFFGDALTDRYGITYKKVDHNMLIDPQMLVVHHRWIHNILYVPPGEEEIYINVIRLGTNYKYLPACVTYNITTAGDGLYELSIKTGEPWYIEKPTPRDFAIKLNGQFIVEEFGPAKYSPPLHSMDLNVIFKILNKGKSIKMEGYAETDILTSDMSIPFELCLGTCSNTDPIAHAGGLSLVKF